MPGRGYGRSATTTNREVRVQTSRRFEPLVTSASDVRRFVSTTLSEWHVEDELVGFLANELATNAILHARTPFEVRLARDETTCRIEVTDSNPRMPVLQPVPPDAPSGHGMMIMNKQALSWGVEPEEEGKTVWCVVAC
jgi:anti-sigma regulatory factor (Ser/Thr protein kinase)